MRCTLYTDPTSNGSHKREKKSMIQSTLFKCCIDTLQKGEMCGIACK